ncbi:MULTISPECIES: hypothetical protein [unclassified Streptomyces]|uniref:hypothetical protein n=1 Tax=unclassified Streptomyces TaxID=2593676 RepID=UPI002096785F|nr:MULTISPECIES: hypothetical protein [unclassified Streptomyces]
MPDDSALSAQVPSEAARLRVGLRVGLRIALVWVLYVVAAALVPGVYGTPVAGAVSLGAVLAVVPLGIGVHGLVVYGRRVDRVAAANEADDRRWA